MLILKAITVVTHGKFVRFGDNVCSCTFYILFDVKESRFGYYVYFQSNLVGYKEEHVASAFRVEELTRQETSVADSKESRLHAVFLLTLLLKSEDGGDRFLRNLG